MVQLTTPRHGWDQLISGADLSFADLSCANLSNANLSNADLFHANLSYVIATGAGWGPVDYFLTYP
jgi:uncharacterized protein YjbI with pentapeptide repeats